MEGVDDYSLKKAFYNFEVNLAREISLDTFNAAISRKECETGQVRPLKEPKVKEDKSSSTKSRNVNNNEEEEDEEDDDL